jgi:DNA-binding NarL/FixJ family response regulator
VQPDVLKMVALSVHTEAHYVPGMLGAGAAGYLDKSSAFSELVRAMRAVTDEALHISCGRRMVPYGGEGYRPWMNMPEGTPTAHAARSGHAGA